MSIFRLTLKYTEYVNPLNIPCHGWKEPRSMFLKKWSTDHLHQVFRNRVNVYTYFLGCPCDFSVQESLWTIPLQSPCILYMIASFCNVYFLHPYMWKQNAGSTQLSVISCLPQAADASFLLLWNEQNEKESELECRREYWGAMECSTWTGVVGRTHGLHFEFVRLRWHCKKGGEGGR